MPQESTASMTRGDRRERVGWYFYDWANSAFATTVATVFLGPYVSNLAREAAGSDGMARLLGIAVAPDSFMPYCISISVVLQVLFLPVLGAVADYSNLRKRLMQFFAVTGSVVTMLMFFVTGESWWLGGLLFVVANLSFGARRLFSTTPSCRISPHRPNATASRRSAGRWAILEAGCCWRSTWFYT